MSKLVLKSNWFPMTIEKDLEVKFAAVGEFVTAAASELAPVATGNLQGSVSHEEGNEGNVYFTRIGTNVEYAPYIEFGTGKHATQPGGRKTPWIYTDEAGRTWRTSGMKAQPFLIPALTLYKSTIKAIFKRA